MKKNADHVTDCTFVHSLHHRLPSNRSSTVAHCSCGPFREWTDSHWQMEERGRNWQQWRQIWGSSECDTAYCWSRAGRTWTTGSAQMERGNKIYAPLGFDVQGGEQFCFVWRTFGVLGELQSLSFLHVAWGIGLAHCKGEDMVLLLLRWRCTLGVPHVDSGFKTLGLKTLGLQILKVWSSELLSLLLLPSSPPLVKSSCWLIPSNGLAMIGAWFWQGIYLKRLSCLLDLNSSN